MSVLKETVLSLSEVVKAYPALNQWTLRTWSKAGLRGMKLETAKIGGKVVTSREALKRFVTTVNGPEAAAVFDKDEALVSAARRLVPGPTGELCADQAD